MTHTTLRQYIVGQTPEMLDAQIAGCVIVLATEGDPIVSGSMPTHQAKELLQIVLSGDWDANKRLN